MELSQRERVPAYYYQHPQTRAILTLNETLSAQAAAAVEDLQRQFWIDTATWSLPLWEEQVGSQGSQSKPMEERREAVLRKLLATGQTTVQMIRELAETITGLEAEVVEDWGAYQVSLRFYGGQGQLILLDLSRLTALIEESKPAHLRFLGVTLIWADLEPLLWEGLEAQHLSWDELEHRCTMLHNRTEGGEPT